MEAQNTGTSSDVESLTETTKELEWNFDTIDEVPEEIQGTTMEWAGYRDDVMDALRLADSKANALLLDLYRATSAAATVQMACIGCEDAEQFENVYLPNIEYANQLLKHKYAKECFAELCSSEFSDDEGYAGRHEKVCELVSVHFEAYL